VNRHRLALHARDLAACCVFLFAVVAILAHCVGCKHVDDAVKDVAKVAGQKFEDDLEWCVWRDEAKEIRRYATERETDACLDAKRHSWGITSLRTTDAGAP
jgi:hypothetical protein